MKYYIALFLTLILFNGFSQNPFSENLKEGANQYNQENYKGALESFSKAYKNKKYAKNDYQIADVLKLQSLCCMTLGKYSSAISYIDKALLLKPEYSDLYYVKALIYRNSGDFEKCIETANNGLIVRPENEELYFLRAYSKYETKDFEGTIADYDTILMINPRNNSALFLIAGALSRIKKHDEAEKYATRSIEIDPQNSGAYYNRGIIRAELKNFIGAKEDMKKGIAIDSTTRWIGYNNIAFFISFKQEDYEGAINYFDESIKLNPDFAYAFNNRGYAKMKLGDMKGAKKDIDKAIEMDSKNSYAYRTKALYLIADGKEDLVCEQLSMAKALGYSEEYDDEVDTLSKQYCK